MLESVVFILLLGAGCFFIIAIAFLGLIGYFSKSRILIKVAFYGSVLPVLCFGLVAFYYLIMIPSHNNSQLQELSGVYLSSTRKEVKIELYKNGRYKSYNPTLIKLQLTKSGTWETGRIDGHINFYSLEGHFINWAIPTSFGNSDTFLEFSNNELFMRSKNNSDNY